MTWQRQARALRGGPQRRRMRFEVRMLSFALFAGFPAVLVTVLLLWFGDYSSATRWTLTSLVVVFWLGAAFSLRSHLVYPLQTLSNLLSALREEDYSLRARGARPDDALGEVLVEVNALSEVLRGRRLGALEATALLRKVMEEIDVAVFTFDSEQCLRLMNRAGERLLGQPSERILGRDCGRTGLGGLPGRRTRPNPDDFLPRGSRALGHAAQRFSRERDAARTPGPDGFKPAPARGRTASVAAADPRPRPRTQ